MTQPHRLRHCSRCGCRLAADNSHAMCSACQNAARDELLRPPPVPREFWCLDQMRDALATWHMGRVIYAYRNHPYHSRVLPQDLLGTWLGLTQAQLSRMETGRAPEELTKLIRYAQILGIPADLLWFDLPGSPRTGSSQRGCPAPDLTLPVVVNGRPVLLPIDSDTARANGLGDLLGEAGGSANHPAPGSGRIVPMRRHAAHSHGVAAHALPSLGLDELQHVAAALADARRYLDGSIVGYFREQFERCKANDGHLGPMRALPSVLAVLGTIEQHARDVRPEVRRALLAVGADGAEFAGWLYRDLGDPLSAAYWYDRAMEWAQEAQNSPMQAYVLLKKSQMAYDERDPTRVLTLAEAARCVRGEPPARVRAEILQQEALGLAMCGEPVRAMERKLDEARLTLASAAGDDREPGSLGAYFDDHTLLLRNASCYTEVGTPAQAAALFHDVLTSGALSHRDMGYYRARRAAALALSGEPGDAAAVALTAVQVAKATSSQRTLRVLTDVVRILAPWSAHPDARALRDAMLA
jgi:transcriptional regulator with XRE-family HTH domain